MSVVNVNVIDKLCIYVVSLVVGLFVMVVGMVYLYIFVNCDGYVDYGFVVLLFWVMSVGLVWGVGFVLCNKVLCMLFLGWVCVLVLMLFGLLCVFG